MRHSSWRRTNFGTQTARTHSFLGARADRVNCFSLCEWVLFSDSIKPSGRKGGNGNQRRDMQGELDRSSKNSWLTCEELGLRSMICCHTHSLIPGDWTKVTCWLFHYQSIVIVARSNMRPRWLHVQYHHNQDKGHFEKLNHYRIIKWVVAAKLAPG